MASPDPRPTHEIDVDELDRLIEAGQVRVLDVRQDWEWRRGHLPGSLHVPLEMLPSFLWKLPREKPLAVICEHGERSLVATHYLLARGFAGARSVSGGTVAWARSQRALEKD